MTATLVQQLAAFAAAHDRPDLPDAVADSVGRRVLDILGIAVAASTLDTSRAALSFVTDNGGAPQASTVGANVLLPAPAAAFAGGVLAHSLDYDDTHLPSILHPSASVIPAAIAAGQAHGRGGAALTAAVAVGLEICVRLGMAGYDREQGNSTFFERGQHATSICGAIGSAAAAARMLALDADGIGDAMGVAVSMASGVIEANRTGGTVKRIHCGWAAQAGVTAAELVSRGLTGPPTVLEGRFGFFEAFLGGTFDESALTNGLGKDWEVPGIFFKPYPANHFTHTGIDAAIRLREAGVTPDDIATLDLRVAAPTVRTIGEPIDGKRTPQTGYQAQFSGPYTVIAGLLGGGGLGVGLEDFTDELACEDRRRDLMAKVSVAADENLAGIYPHQFPCVLVAHLHDGSQVTEEVLVNRGGPDNPLTDDELTRKFTDNAARVIDDRTAARMVDCALHLDDVDDLAALFPSG